MRILPETLLVPYEAGIAREVPLAEPDEVLHMWQAGRGPPAAASPFATSRDDVSRAGALLALQVLRFGPSVPGRESTVGAHGRQEDEETVGYRG